MINDWNVLLTKPLHKNAMLLLALELFPLFAFAQETAQKSQEQTTTSHAVIKPDHNIAPLTAEETTIAQIFSVASAEKTAEHPFYNQGSKTGFSIDGISGKELVLTRGATYIFDVSSSVKHDLYFSKKAKGLGSSTVTDGITGQFIHQGQIIFSPNDLNPGRIFYACRNHQYMGGLIHIINKGDTVTLEGSDINLATQPVSESEIMQKIITAKDMTTGAAAKRVENSTDSSAKGLLKKAKNHISAAETALKTGKPHEALNIVKTALNNLHSAIDMVPEENSIIDQRAKYKKLLDNFRIYKDSYQQQYKQAKKQGETSFDSHPNPSSFEKMDDDAAKLSVNNEYAKANKVLMQAQEMILVALTSVFEGKEIIYDKNFSTAVEEFEYELARNKNFEELIPVAIAKRRPSQAIIDLMHSYVEKSKTITAEAISLAYKGDHATAV